MLTRIVSLFSLILWVLPLGVRLRALAHRAREQLTIKADPIEQSRQRVRREVATMVLVLY